MIELFEFEKYRFVNYVSLSREHIELVLEERNKKEVRKWMDNNKPISLNDHLKFIESLHNTKTKFYWLVFRDSKPIGAVYITDIDWEKKTGVWGYFLFTSYQGVGWGIDIQYYALSIFFNKLKLDCVFGYVLNENTNSINIQPIFNFIIYQQRDNHLIFKLSKENYDLLPSDIKEFKNKNILNYGKT